MTRHRAAETQASPPLLQQKLLLTALATCLQALFRPHLLAPTAPAAAAVAPHSPTLLKVSSLRLSTGHADARLCYLRLWVGFLMEVSDPTLPRTHVSVHIWTLAF